jgi:lipopolysaccharide transport system permease protein
MMSNEKQDWTEVIKPQRAALDINWQELWQYRDLLFLLVKRDVVAFYKQTLLGPLWFFIQPIFTIIIFTFIFGNVAGISTDGLPAPLFYLAGLILWNYFAECFNKTATTFRDNASLFGKVYFPRLILPLSVVVSSLLKLLLQFLLFGIFIVYYLITSKAAIQPNALIVITPLLFLLVAFLGLAGGLIITSLTTKYRDLVFLIGFGVQLLMYATTVIYPLSAVPEKYKIYIQWNPITPIIETFRYSFLGAGEFSPIMLLYSGMSILLLLIFGIMVFNKVERNFMDTV